MPRIFLRATLLAVALSFIAIKAIHPMEQNYSPDILLPFLNKRFSVSPQTEHSFKHSVFVSPNREVIYAIEGNVPSTWILEDGTVRLHYSFNIQSGQLETPVYHIFATCVLYANGEAVCKYGAYGHGGYSDFAYDLPDELR